MTTPGETPVCSAKGCRAPARWALVWNNPRLHTPDREKVWTACDEHRPTLSDHLAARSFLRRVDPLAEAGPDHDRPAAGRPTAPGPDGRMIGP